MLTSLAAVRTPVAAALDAAAILVFVAIGRSAHAHGGGARGLASTAWPFLAGALLGWIGARAWRDPGAIVPGGVTIWLSCVALGMVLRVVAGQGTATAFVFVALAFLGLEFVGWRVLARVVTAQRGRRGAVRSADHGHFER